MFTKPSSVAQFVVSFAVTFFGFPTILFSKQFGGHTSLHQLGAYPASMHVLSSDTSHS